MENIYIILGIVCVILLVSSIFVIRNIFNKVIKKKSTNAKKTIEELHKKIRENPKDYRAMYELAKCEEETGETKEAFEKYELLINLGVLPKSEELIIYKKLENKYEELGEKEKAFKYSIKIMEAEPNNNFHTIKIANILAKEGSFQPSLHYFNKAFNSEKNKFEIEDLKAAAFVSYKMKDYKRCIVFLEELIKIMYKESNNIKEINDLERDLISMYILCEELNRVKSFIENALLNKGIESEHLFQLNKSYLFVLYKLEENDKFKTLYNQLYSIYKIESADRKYAPLILDYSFYSYFLLNIESSKYFFETLQSFDIPEFNIYNIEKILEYLNEIIKATSALNKLRNAMNLYNYKYKNDNYENYVNKENIKMWEDSVNLWESSFININYVPNLIEVKNTINVDNILMEIKIEKKIEGDSNLKIIQKVDKLQSLDKLYFKKLCQNIMRSKFSNYVVVQEYTDESNPTVHSEEENFLTYHVKGNKNELTLISFKKWKQMEIGELVIRDFLIMVTESGAKNGILIAPVQLSKSAKNYVSHNDRITVYTKNQFNNFLKDENI